MFTIIIWDDGLPIPLITGIGGTVVDFFDGFYYDPWVGSELYNWSTNQTLHIGTDRGARWIYPALVFHPVYPTARNQWYCNYTVHYAIDRIIFFKQNGIDPGRMSDLNPLGTDLTAPQDAYYLGELQVCHKVQEQCGSNCQTPTPTPSPSPTPVEVKTVGFDNDYQLYRFPSGAPISDPTWTRGGSANSTNYVAYKKGADNTQLDVVFDINPAPPSGDGFSMRARAKYSGNVIAETPNNVSVTSSTITINNLAVNQSVLEPTPQVKKGVYTFNWEVSVDNGSTWRAAGNSEHTIYWLYDAPAAPVSPDVNACVNDGIPRNCLFVFGQGELELPGLFDKALEIAIDDLNPATQSPDAIAQFLAAKIDNWVVYDPGPAGGAADLRHPLFIWTESRRAQCSANANLLHGLMRSIGIDSEAIYFWGGSPTNPETGGKVHSYRYRKPSGAEPSVTFRTVRPPKVLGGEDLELNPHFAFHSMVKLNGKYFDPSYGAEPLVGYPYTNISLTEIVTFKNNNPNKPKFKKDAETFPFVVSALNMSTFCSPNTSNGNCSGNPNTIWTSKLCKKHSDKVPKTSVPHAVTHFDADELSDVAIWRPSDGSWWVVNSLTQTGTNYGAWGLTGDKPVPADFDGDGRTDRAVFRPSNGTWYILKSSDSSWIVRQFGLNGDRPVFGDFDGDGKSDIAVWRPSGGDWYWLNSSDDSFHGFHFGMNGDVPVSGDYDGNGTTDFMVYRPTNGAWYLNTGTNYTAYTFGLADDIPVSGDFDSDGIDDIALFRPSTAVWYILQSSDGFTAFQFGDPGDVPSTGDYNNDDGVDAAVWTASTGRWRILNLDNGSITDNYWGMTGDIPIPSAYNR